MAIKSRLKYIVIIYCFFFLYFKGISQSYGFDAGSKIKAVYLYGFTRSFEWPANKKENSFIIYVVGKNDKLISELQALALKKKVGNQDIKIQNTMDYDPSIVSHMIYFSPDLIKPISVASSKNKKKGTLIIGEEKTACTKGASINFVIVDSKLKFEYNKSSAVSAGLETKEDFKTLALKNY